MDLPPKSRRYSAAVAAAKFADLCLEFRTRKNYNGSRKRFAVFCMKEWYPDLLNNRFVGVSRTRLGVVFYPFCWFPFPVDFSNSDDGVGDRHDDATDLPDNDTFEYDGSERVTTAVWMNIIPVILTASQTAPTKITTTMTSSDCWYR
ncbi:hypothetical protein PR003_g8483 [Phytophthora rubi]|uniref:Uncharacterized protein n=1 Tax=Phytophthora rubi TaxID=129364 RepID=A0A6A3NA67_9STRA|nr:hypothetical protein PR001_g8463 [Phytophthora rubi]KAE9344406.1 hypothetical protein PR003_g8483 [Phytophthora rubi]